MTKRLTFYGNTLNINFVIKWNPLSYREKEKVKKKSYPFLPYPLVCSSNFTPIQIWAFVK